MLIRNLKHNLAVFLHLCFRLHQQSETKRHEIQRRIRGVDEHWQGSTSARSQD